MIVGGPVPFGGWGWCLCLGGSVVWLVGWLVWFWVEEVVVVVVVVEGEGEGRMTISVTQRDSVWKGACGMRPLGKGRPRRPATPVVRPRRKRSQWKPAGLRRGNSVPWAMREETVVVC